MLSYGVASRAVASTRRPRAKEELALACLITGIGYIGATLAEHLLDLGQLVIGVDNLFSTDRRAIARLKRRAGFTFVRGSVARRDTLARAFAAAAVEVVYATAAQASAHPQAATPHYTEIVNLLSPRLLLDEAVARGVRTVIYASSFRVYGAVPPTLAVESGPYGSFGDLSHLSKVYVEKLLEMYADKYGLRCAPVRLGLAYGVGPAMKTDHRFMTAPNKFCLQAVRGEPLVVSAAGVLPTGMIHVADAARALARAAELSNGQAYSPLNAATEAASALDAARLVAAAAERRGLRVRLEAPRAAVGAVTGSGRVPSRLWEVGFAATRTLAQGVDETVDYFLAAERGKAGR